VTIEMLVPGLPVADILGIVAFAALLVALLIHFAHHLKQVKGAVRTFVLPGEAALSCSESIVTCTDSDWFTDRETLSTYYDWFATWETLSNIVIRQWHDNKNLQSQIAAAESAHKDKIADIKDKDNDRGLTFLREISDLRTDIKNQKEHFQKQIATKEREHQDEIAAKERTHQNALIAKDSEHKIEIDRLNNAHRRSNDRYSSLDQKHHEELREETYKRKEAERKLEEVAQTSPQTLTAPDAAESSIAEAEDDLLAETEGLSEAESTNSTEHEQEQEEEEEWEEEEEEEVEEHEPHNSGTPLPEPSSMGEGAEQIPQDQEKGLAQDAPVPTEEPAATLQLTEPEAAFGPATSDDGASEAPVTKEVLPEGQAGDGETEEPTPVEESDEDEVRGTTAGDDGAFMASATSESDQPLLLWDTMRRAHDTPYVPRNGSATVGDLLGGVDRMGISRRVKAADDSPSANPFELPEMVARLISPQPPSAIADDSGNDMECETSDETSSSGQMIPDNEGTANDSNAGQSNPVSDETSSPPDDMDTTDSDAIANDSGTEQSSSTTGTSLDPNMEIDSGEGTVNHSGNEQDNSAGEIAIDLSGQGQTANDYGYVGLANDVSKAANGEPLDLTDVDFEEDTTIESQTGHAYPANEVQQGSGMEVDSPDGGASGLGSQYDDVTMETAPPLHQTLGDGHGLPSQFSNVPTTEMAQPSHQPHDNGQGPPSQFNNVPPTETAPPAWQQHQNAPPPQLVRPLPGTIPLGPSSGPVKWNLSGTAVFWRQLRWRGTIEWDLSRPLTFTRPFRISQPAQQPLSSRRGLPKWRVLAELGSKVATQNTKSFKWQPPSQPVTQANLPLAPGTQDTRIDPSHKATAIKGWVVEANDLATRWMLSPDEDIERGTDAASFSKMSEDPDSEFSLIVDQAKKDADYLENELKESDLKISARRKFCITVLPAVESMREQFEQLKTLKGCPLLFLVLLRDINRMLTVLRGLESGPTIQPAKPQPSTPDLQDTQQTRVKGNPLLASDIRDIPLEIAYNINKYVKDAKLQARKWMNNPEDGETDKKFFEKMKLDFSSALWTITVNMSDAVDYLEHEYKLLPKTDGANAFYLVYVLPSVESLRRQFEELGAARDCLGVFETLLEHVDRILKALRKLKEDSSTPLAQRQPPAQSTQQIPPQQPVPQIGNPHHLATHTQPPAPVVQSTQQAPSQQPISQIGSPHLLATQPQPPQVPSQQPAPQFANPLFRYAEPHEAATEIKKAIGRMKNRPDGPKVIHEMRWTADFLQSGPKSTHKANHILRSCLRDAQDMYQQYRNLCNTYPHDHVLQSLKTAVDRVVEQLEKYK
jgi:hypothetical protein